MIVADAAVIGLFLVLPWLYFWRLFTPYAPDQMTLAEGDFNVEFFPLPVPSAQSSAAASCPSGIRGPTPGSL